MPGETTGDADLTLPEEIKIAMLNYTNRFHQELEICSKAMDHISVFTIIQPFSLILQKTYLRSGKILNPGAFVSSLNGSQGNGHGYLSFFWNLM